MTLHQSMNTAHAPAGQGIEHEHLEEVEHPDRTGVQPGGLWAGRLVFTAGLAVALAAAAATAHGLYEVVRACGGPVFIAGLYPLMTDGLALVAYTATARLSGHGRRYAWTIVILAAGMSGLAQATYLAGGVNTAPDWLRAGVGGWPAVAAAIVAHLLYLLGARHADQPGPAVGHEAEQRAMDQQTVPPELNSPVDGVRRDGELPAHPNGSTFSTQDRGVHPDAGQHTGEAVQPGAEQPEPGPPGIERHGVQPPTRIPGDGVQPPRPKPDGNGSTARSRATSAAEQHRASHGELPSVTELTSLAAVSRGTASNVLKHLRIAQNGHHTSEDEHDPRSST